MDEWKCVRCPKSKASQHEELCMFGKYCTNKTKKEEAEKDITYCAECFEIRSKELDEI